MEIQAGTCNGHGHKLNALEYHKCSEVNLSSRGLVLLLALPSQLHDGHMDSRDVVGFYLPPAVAVEICPLVLHFAPCRVTEDGFDCLVVLQKGTNAPLERAEPSASGEEKPAPAVRELVLYEPGADAVYNAIVPNYIAGMLYGAMCESVASELAARRTAMDAASKNAAEMIDDLSLRYNRARQGAITQEITEIVAGAEQ